MNEEVTIKASQPPGAVSLPENTSPVKDTSVKEIHQDTLQNAPLSASSAVTPEERARRKAYIVQALERGVINDRMSVPLPNDLYGCWVRRDQMEIDHMKRMGFRIDTEFATQRALHTDGTGAAFVGDVVHMVTEKWNKELIDEVKQERFLQHHSKTGKKDKEEKDFASGTSAETDGVIPTMNESRTRELRKGEIAAAMTEMATQTKPQKMP